MISILYEADVSVATSELSDIHIPSMVGEIVVSSESASKKANSYLSLEVAMEFQPGKPVLVWRNQPVWRIPINLHLKDFGELATLGTLEVDASTRVVTPLTSKQINIMRTCAHGIVTSFSSAAEATI